MPLFANQQLPYDEKRNMAKEKDMVSGYSNPHFVVSCLENIEMPCQEGTVPISTSRRNVLLCKNYVPWYWNNIYDSHSWRLFSILQRQSNSHGLHTVVSLMAESRRQPRHHVRQRGRPGLRCDPDPMRDKRFEFTNQQQKTRALYRLSKLIGCSGTV